MKSSKLFIILLINMMTTFISAQNLEDSVAVQAKIVMSQNGEMINLKATGTNNTRVFEELNYLLISVKQGPTGNISNNKQQGKFVIKPGESKMLSETNINLKSTDQLKVYLFIRDEQKNKLVSKDSLEISSTNKNEGLSQEASEELEMFKGLVLENTKTKVGRDFFDFFYSQYSQLPEKYNFIINITEQPVRGQRGQIIIESDDKLLYSFITNPNEDYLKAQANALLNILKEYNQKKTLINKEIMY